MVETLRGVPNLIEKLRAAETPETQAYDFSHKMWIPLGRQVPESSARVPPFIVRSVAAVASAEEKINSPVKAIVSGASGSGASIRSNRVPLQNDEAGATSLSSSLLGFSRFIPTMFAPKSEVVPPRNLSWKSQEALAAIVASSPRATFLDVAKSIVQGKLLKPEEEAKPEYLQLKYSAQMLGSEPGVLNLEATPSVSTGDSAAAEALGVVPRPWSQLFVQQQQRVARPSVPLPKSAVPLANPQNHSLSTWHMGLKAEHYRRASNRADGVQNCIWTPHVSDFSAESPIHEETLKRFVERWSAGEPIGRLTRNV